MSGRHKRAVRGALFLSFGVGGLCFFISLFILLWLGVVTGHVGLDIIPFFPFVPAPKKPMGWWEIGTLLVSFVMSALAGEFVFRFCKKYILPNRPHS
jgi:hypothetical protein